MMDRRLKVGSLFAGIGGFDLGFERAGFDVAWCVEWDKKAQAVLRRRFPKAIVHGDIREIDPDSLERVDVICGGFPCQDLSVAGKRAGLAGERSGLFHDAMRIVRRLRPELLVLENVPGLLSSNRGLDFATVLREVGEGWPCAEVGWRVLDSRYFGVAQRRRRVFVVAGSRVGCAESLLALSESVSWHPHKERASRKGSATDAQAGSRVDRYAGWLEGDLDSTASVCSKWSKGSGGPSGDERYNLVVESRSDAVAINAIAFAQNQAGEVRLDRVIPTMGTNANASGRATPMIAIDVYNGKIDGECCATVTSATGIGNASGPKAIAFHPTQDPIPFSKSKRARSDSDDESWVAASASNTLNQFDSSERDTHAIVFHPTQDPISSTDGSTHALGCGSKQGCATVAVVHVRKSRRAQNESDFETWVPSDTTNTLNGFDVGDIRSTDIVATPSMIVRRLTPTECERLQGFPDDWTQIGTLEKPTADSHRYKQLGNAVTVNVAEWIARRAMSFLAR